MPALRAVLSAVATFLVVAEVVCRLLPVSTATETDYRRDPLIRTYPAHHRWVTSTGWDLRRPQWMAANNAGFAAAHDFSFNPQAIALIGDSYVEASMLKTSERLAHRLEMVLGGQRPVYAMGSPGTSLLDYAERIRWARQHYGVRDVVLFVEASDVLQSYCGSGNVEGVCLDAATGEVRTSTLPPASDAKRWLRQSAFAQYLVSQLRFDPGRIWQQVLAQSRAGHAPKDVRRPDGPQRDPKRIDAVNQVLQAFLARTDRQPPGRLIMVLDGRRGVARPGRGRGGSRLRRRASRPSRAR